MNDVKLMRRGFEKF